MPLQNRVDPWGRIVACPSRGSRMGNRGILHDAAQQVGKTHTHQAWVCCLTEFKGRKRALMQPGAYTELFFLDEVTALAAGHRPCGECQRDRYTAFTEAWCAVHGDPPEGRALPKHIDRMMHAARIHRREKVTFEAEVAGLPDGVMVAVGDAAFLLWRGVWRWSFDGYTPADSLPERVTVLTPAPVVEVLRAGYVPQTWIKG